MLACMVGLKNQLTVTESMKKLEAHQAAWDALKWSESYKIPMSKASMTWELIGGVFNHP
jgi:hypothetical protein